MARETGMAVIEMTVRATRRGRRRRRCRRGGWRCPALEHVVEEDLHEGGVVVGGVELDAGVLGLKLGEDWRADLMTFHELASGFWMIETSSEGRISPWVPGRCLT